MHAFLVKYLLRCDEIKKKGKFKGNGKKMIWVYGTHIVLHL